MDWLQFAVTSVVMPILIGLLTGGLGVVLYNGYQDRKRRISAQPIEAKKLELDATDRVIKNILDVQDHMVEENRRLGTRIIETELQIKQTTAESDRRFEEIQSLLDEALEKLAAYRRYLQRVRRELARQDIQMPEPDPGDAPLINL